MACAYLLVEGNEATFIENNTTHALPHLLTALQSTGLTPEQVRYLMVTHVHLDHAGGTSALLRLCPNATVLAHPRASQHLIDPTKLIASAEAVYGTKQFKDLYGEITAIPENRVRSLNDNESVGWGNRELVALYTKGHANHHLCVWDSKTHSLFTGDAFGLAYPELQTHGLFLFPSTSPTQFLPQEAIASVNRLVALNPKKLFLTHFGMVDDIPKAQSQMLNELNFSEQLALEAKASGGGFDNIQTFCYPKIENHLKKRALDLGLGPWESLRPLLELDMKLNAAGLAHWASL